MRPVGLTAFFLIWRTRRHSLSGELNILTPIYHLGIRCTVSQCIVLFITAYSSDIQLVCMLTTDSIL